MKENEAKRPKVAIVGGGRNAGKTFKALLDLLEELEAYRTIGTVKEIRIREAEFAVLSKRYLSDLTSLREYQTIGTVEEFKAFKLGRLGNRGFITIGQTIEEFKQEIRAKAIDEFAEKITLEISESIIWDMLATMNKNGNLSDTSDKIVDYVIDTAKRIAEQMKGEQNE